LFSENRILTKENRFLKSECKLLNTRISDLDKNISSIKSKYEIITNNVGKFNKGKENLNNLLSFQKISNNRHGLGFSTKKISNHVSTSISNNHISNVKKNHAFLYSRFVKSSHNYDYDSYNNKSISMHKSSPFLHNITHSMFMWIPRNISLNDKNEYISNYKNKICDSVNYFCINKGKPNSKWIWSPKS